MSRNAAVRTRFHPVLPFQEPTWEDPAYLSSQLVTYIGNKRALLEPIRAAVEDVCSRLGKTELRMLDAFSGSGVVARLFKKYARELVVNDFEDYARELSTCYLTNRSDFPEDLMQDAIQRLNTQVDSSQGTHQGFIERMYAPRDERRITASDRVFYTRENARRLDAYRTLIALEAEPIQNWLLGPLLSEASIHANTAGVFKGFYKDRATGVGRFGGSGSDALIRILGEIRLDLPILSNYQSKVEVFQSDANELVDQVGGFDLAYFDPPYNQHPYGSNYFMLNLLVNYVEPTDISKVSGIPPDWRRSPYYVRSRALTSLDALIRRVDARFVLLSYNNEGFISIDEVRQLLGSAGSFQELQLKYATFRGSRNLRSRSFHVTEHLFLLEKSTNRV